jgi:hypothetical protein
MFSFSTRVLSGIFMIGAIAVAVSGQDVTRPERLAQITALRRQIAQPESSPSVSLAELHRQLREQEDAFLSPDPEDLKKFAAYTRNWDTGVIRILPREKFGKLLSQGEGGSYYSFAGLTHEYAFGDDLELDQGKFSTGFAGANFGFLAALGDVPLEQISEDSARVRTLADYAPPRDEPHARVEQRRFNEQFEHGGLGYVKSIPTAVGQSYVVRSINYRNSDILAAFRVVRQDGDGSLILVWKMLRRYPAPRLDNG